MGAVGVRAERTFWMRERRPVSWPLTVCIVGTATNP